jgi:arylsulfatase
MNEFYGREFWRFVMVQQYMLQLGANRDPTSADAGTATFNLEARKRQVQETIKLHKGD